MAESWNKIKAADEAGKAAKDKKKAEEEKAVWDCVEMLPAKMKCVTHLHLEVCC